MKKLLPILLAAILLASLLSSCAFSKQTALDPNITVTSSDASDAAAWLDERLGAIDSRIVIGTNADGYNVDLSALEADGYFIRSFGREDVLFARTADGLDRAVRRYAKMAEAGNVEDVTYHEGFRVKAIELAGRDISEYTICAGDEPRLLTAANELASLIERACGASLPVVSGEPVAPYIAIDFVHDETLNTCGYRWSVAEDGLMIECSDLYKPTSPHFAVIRFVENELGWFGLTFGYEALADAELISIPVGESGGETNAFRYACPYGDQYSGSIGDAFDHTYGNHYGGFASTHLCGIPQCCHGMQSYKFGGALSTSPNHNWAADQPCYLDEDFFEESYDDVAAFIESQLAAGKVIGEDFFFVDIAAGDNGNWCGCKECQKMLRAEGSVSASVLTWANRLTEALDEDYPGLAYGIFGYAGTNKPPKTVRANGLIYVTYCYDMSCDMHAHDGRDCNGAEPLFDSVKNRSNATMSANLEGWLDMTENVYVWFYGMDQGFLTMNYVDLVKDDLRYFHDIGVKGFFWEAEDYGFSTGKISKWMQSALTWDIDMTDAEYDEYLDRVLAAMYGDGADFIKEYCRAVGQIQRSGACAHCWYSAADTPSLVAKPYAESFDSLYALTEAAIRNADSRRQEARAVKLWANCVYQGCASSYFAAYEAGDDERCAELSRRFSLIEGRLASIGINIGYWKGGVCPPKDEFDSDMELMAWTVWKDHAATLLLTVPTREMPERVAAILAEREALD